MLHRHRIVINGALFQTQCGHKQLRPSDDGSSRGAFVNKITDSVTHKPEKNALSVTHTKHEKMK